MDFAPSIGRVEHNYRRGSDRQRREGVNRKDVPSVEHHPQPATPPTSSRASGSLETGYSGLSMTMKKLILGLAKLFLPNKLARQLQRKQSKQPKRKFPRISEVNCWSAFLNFHLLFLNNWFWI